MNRKILKLELKMKKNENFNEEDIYVWFWNSSLDPWNAQSNNQWYPFKIQDSNEIEAAFLKGAEKFNLKKHKIVFDYNENPFHYQVSKKDANKKRPVIRELPHLVTSAIRYDRFDRLPDFLSKPFSSKINSDVIFFSYQEIFGVNKGEIEKFGKDFNECVCFFKEKIQYYLVNSYKTYFFSKYGNDPLKFLNSKNILINEFTTYNTKISKKEEKLAPTYFDYCNNLSEENLKRFIIKLYSLEGVLYEEVNKIMRTLNFSGKEQLVFYILLLIFSICSLDKQSKKGKFTVYRGFNLEEKDYKNFIKPLVMDNFYINFDFLSTTKNKKIVEESFKNILRPREVIIEIELLKYGHSGLSLRSFELSKEYSILPHEEELLLCPNHIFKIISIQEETDHKTTIKLECDSSIFNNFKEKNYGVYFLKKEILDIYPSKIIEVYKLLSSSDSDFSYFIENLDSFPKLRSFNSFL